ncbi:uncharacterized protein Pyn_26109 [Prunus yedoensis var. nudiflora]|uniref:Transposase MuDR plant domain-containing protein n=1 Tax=Prunus yedoensis var. nudiflora TaxID=2094558 RepID=A0A314Y0B8_PRUYE|nr:uncharacterized protein Pyn_26109 [Prunus yedoensis var. nudiflora]
MTVPREKGGSQPEYDDKAIVTFEVHHGSRMLLEIYAYAKELGHHDQVVVTGIQNGKKVCIDSDAQLLDWCHLVPPSFQRVIVIYLELPTVINVDESAVAWRERGPIARNLTVEFEQPGYEGMYEEDEEDEEDGIAVDEEEEGYEGTIPVGTNVAEDRHEGTAHEGTNVAEDRHGIGMKALHMRVQRWLRIGMKALFLRQSEDEQRLLEKDDRAFDNYVDHNAPYIDPAVDEGEKSDDMAVSDVNSWDSSSCDEVDLRMRKRKRKLPKRKIKFSKNDKDKVRAVCDGIKNGKCPWFVYASAVNGSSMVLIKSYEEEHTCGTVEHNVHANSSWLAERYATQLSGIINWDIGAFEERSKAKGNCCK